MMACTKFLPGTGRGTARRVVEGASRLPQGCVVQRPPSVTRFARATSPQVVRILL
jgi:hypothetical protein